MTTTPNLGIVLPTVGADSDTWGTKLNAGLTLIDTFAGVNPLATGIAAQLSDGTLGLPKLQKTTGIAQSSATDVFRFLDRSGSQIGLTFVCGILNINVVDEANAANNTSFVAFINSTGNGASNAVAEAFAAAGGGDTSVVRGTSLLTASLIQLANDGGAGGVKVQLLTAASGKTVTARVGFIGMAK